MHKVLEKIRDPRETRVFYLLVYGLVAIAGAAAIISPPESIAGELGYKLTVVWGLFLLFGGIAGLIAVNPGYWWLERAACLAAAVGTGMYATVVASMLMHPGNRVPQNAMILIVFLLLAFRFWRIRGFDLEPRG